MCLASTRLYRGKRSAAGADTLGWLSAASCVSNVPACFTPASDGLSSCPAASSSSFCLSRRSAVIPALPARSPPSKPACHACSAHPSSGERHLPCVHCNLLMKAAAGAAHSRWGCVHDTNAVLCISISTPGDCLCCCSDLANAATWCSLCAWKWWCAQTSSVTECALRPCQEGRIRQQACCVSQRHVQQIQMQHSGTVLMYILQLLSKFAAPLHI